jgi:hypothetical protein
MNDEKSVFETLSAIDITDHVEKKEYTTKKGRFVSLKYLSWAWAWAIIKGIYPNAQCIVYERDNGINYWTDGRTCWVKTGIKIEDLEHIEYLPIMDEYNKSILIDKVTSFDVNTAIQRSATKAMARHGLGLDLYVGEDILKPSQDDVKKPENEKNDEIDLTKEILRNNELIIQGLKEEVSLDFKSEKGKKIVMKYAETQTTDVSELTAEGVKKINDVMEQLIKKKTEGIT